MCRTSSDPRTLSSYKEWPLSECVSFKSLLTSPSRARPFVRTLYDPTPNQEIQHEVYDLFLGPLVVDRSRDAHPQRCSSSGHRDVPKYVSFFFRLSVVKGLVTERVFLAPVAVNLGLTEVFPVEGTYFNTIGSTTGSQLAVHHPSGPSDPVVPTTFTFIPTDSTFMAYTQTATTKFGHLVLASDGSKHLTVNSYVPVFPNLAKRMGC